MESVYRIWKSVVTLAVILLTVASCSTTKHVGDGEYLLDHMSIEVDGAPEVSGKDLVNYVRQRPNARMLGIGPARLHTYSLSGVDTTRWYNRWLRRLGEAPVIYNRGLTDASQRQLTLALVNRGYLEARVEVDTMHTGDKKLDVTYRVKPGGAHRISSLNWECEDDALRWEVMADTAETLLRVGANLDRTLLDGERTRITNKMQERGYYLFNKDYVKFRADTLAGSHDVGLSVQIKGDGHRRFMVRKVIYDPAYDPSITSGQDTIQAGDIYIVTNPEEDWRYVSAKVLEDYNRITPNAPYNIKEINQTYESLTRLGIIRSTNIQVEPVGLDGTQVDVIVRLMRNQTHGITMELEGTNSEGDLGVGVGVTYQQRNLFHGSELLTVKGHGSYESLSGNLEGLLNNHYTEASAEVAITFPKFMMPLLSKRYKKSMPASTEFAISGNYQERPEYTRVISGVAWRYKWSNPHNNNRRVFDLIDVSYVFLPRSTINFLDEVGAGNPLLRYSYENHLIMRMGYSTYLTNKRTGIGLGGVSGAAQRKVWTLRWSSEVAGNVLYALSKISGAKKDDGAYKIFGTAYSQYAKTDGDYVVTHRYTPRLSVAAHVGMGVAVPYGNSQMVPFEKRFYAGGANSVRGWSVRTLGPGRYDSRNTVSNFINQCGDIRLDLSIEARVKLFWVLEGAAFIDAGNVWTIRSYENQAGGLFRFGTFYKELAWAYGAGVRMDFTYFILRFDLGLKAYNPAEGQQAWPLTHMQWRRDAAFHFSVGYPF